MMVPPLKAYYRGSWSLVKGGVDSSLVNEASQTDAIGIYCLSGFWTVEKGIGEE